MKRRYVHELPAEQKGHYALVVAFLLAGFAIMALFSSLYPGAAEAPTMSIENGGSIQAASAREAIGE